MARKPVSMRKIREIIRLSRLGGLSNRQIASSCSLSPTSVGKVVTAARESGLLGMDLPEMTEAELRRLLFGEKASPKPSKPLPDMGETAKELSRKGVTIQLLWEEYIRDNPGGYGYTQFCRYLRDWQAAQDPTMRFEHAGGDKMFVDWAGQTIRCGPENREGYLFVAVLGASNYTFANVYSNMKMESWIRAHVDALDFFGGVPRLIVPDNARTAVSKACFYDPDVNRTYQELAEHYGAAVLPTRARKPRDKAKGENAVQNAERRILAALRDMQFHTLGQLQEAVRAKNADLNARPFSKMEGSRLELFNSLDRPALKALPRHTFSLGSWQKAIVYKDYHIQVDRHYYSVPHTHVGKTVEVRVTDRTVEVYDDGVRLATHQRSFIKGKATTMAEHRSQAHRVTLEQDAAMFIARAAQVGPQCKAAVEMIFSKVPHPEMAFRGCSGVLRLARQYGGERLEAACDRAVRTGTVRYSTLAGMLKNGLETQPLPGQSRGHASGHANVRGASYYGGREVQSC